MENGPDILIAGAGPTGLTAAVELSRRGIIPKIIDRKEAPSPLSRAVGIMPASLNILKPSGVTDHLVEEGIKMKFAQIFRADKLLLRISLEGGHPEWDYAIALPQDRTEHALIDAFGRFGGKIDFGNELTAIHQEDDKVIVNINNGPDEKYDYVLGADGIHSAVRKGLGIEYPGYDLPETWSIADVDALNWPYPEAGTICILPHGDMAFIVALDQDRYRIVSNTENALTTLPLKLEVTNKHREGQFKISIRQVKEYQKGRAFLAGDAAHCHSPAGGRGMNLGIADAAEWARRITDNDLEGYSRSRHEAGAATIALSERLRRTMSSKSPFTKSILTVFAGAVNIFPPLRSRMAKTFLDG